LNDVDHLLLKLSHFRVKQTETDDTCKSPSDVSKSGGNSCGSANYLSANFL